MKKTLLIGAGVIGVLAIGMTIAYKLFDKHLDQACKNICFDEM